ncbi:hypothetical protein FA13DRAFT_1711685 [Coprinellus micaceus]|uniref:Uncharacterized protein n=1 Tax=Coprinellus micaceus TaxID=71717 RepID=A0A4Y7T3D5_COPMI|nr:hypothetical protein FA13DRAFT_1711685 [Coprinellus micaceus]
MPKDESATSISAPGLHPIGHIATRALARPPVRRASVVGVPSRLRYGFVPSSYMPSLSVSDVFGVGSSASIVVAGVGLEKPEVELGVPKNAAVKRALVRRGSENSQGSSMSFHGTEAPELEVEATEHQRSEAAFSGDPLLNHAKDRRDQVDTRLDFGPEAGASQERLRLEGAIQVIDTLNNRIGAMERTEQRLKKQLREEKERLKNSKADAEGALHLLVMAEEKIAEAENQVVAMRDDVDRYRRWWLTEYYSLKVVLAKLSHADRIDVYHIFEAAQERFETFSNTRG